MFTRKKSERCKYCSKFLTDDQKQMDRTLCVECAGSIASGIKKSFKIRTVIGVLCIVVVFAFIHYMSIAAFEYGAGVLRVIRVPTIFGYMTYRPTTFENIMSFSVLDRTLLGAVTFTVPFARRIRFGMDAYYTFSTQYASNPHASDHPYVIQAGHARGQGDRLGLLISELFLSAISGPYFFVRGAVTIWSMEKYVRGR